MKLSSKKEAFAQATAKWYVYELIDPRDGEPFYVGKGCKNRIKSHEKEAAKQLGVCSEKILRIKDIWNLGLKVEHKFVAYFWNEQDAYDFEASLIDCSALDNLTNIIRGGGGAYIRGHGMTPERYAKIMMHANNLFGYFAKWVMHKEIKTSYIEDIHPNNKALMQFCLFELFPKFWKSIRNSKNALDLLKPEFLKHGVELNYGSA
jgi:hypothetical protein